METALVVVEDTLLRDLLEVALDLEGFTVFTASSGEEALGIIRSARMDLVAIDLLTSGMSGWELSERLASPGSGGGVRQLILSADRSADDIRLGLPHVDAVLRTPLDFGELTAVLRDLVALDARADDAQALPEQLGHLLRERSIFPVFQPIVDLENRTVVGVEALARGPHGPLHLPGALFAAANRAGRLFEVDSLCRFSALRDARDAAPLTPPLVFVNVEPGTVELPMTAELRALLAGPLPFRVVVEFTERALTRRLPALMRHAEEIRGRGNIVALDDLGVDPRAIALLPLLQPEIVKLDMSLLAPSLSPQAAATAVAVAAYAERTGAMVIAEGIETEHQLTTAISLGAHWGQGFLFARPGPMEALARLPVSREVHRWPARTSRAGPDETPFDLATRTIRPRVAHGALVADLARQLEGRADTLGSVGVVLVAVQDNKLMPVLLGPGYQAIARKAAIFGLLGCNSPPVPVPGAYVVELAPDDPLCREWALILLGPYDAVMLSARDLTHEQSPEKRMIEFVLSHDRDLTEQVARLLIRRFTPRDAMGRTTALAAPPIPVAVTDQQG